MRAELRAKYTIDGKFPHKCKACGEFFYTYRPDAQTCSAKCRKAFSRSPAGHLARLERLAKSDERKETRQSKRDYQVTLKWIRQLRAVHLGKSPDFDSMKRAKGKVVEESARNPVPRLKQKY